MPMVRPLSLAARAAGFAAVAALLALPGRSDAYVTGGADWDGPGQNAATVRYHFVNATADLPVDVQQAELRRAMGVWATYAAITWEPIDQPNQLRSVDISWHSGAHGDSTPFDGPGGLLGHTYLPPPNVFETNAGNVHLDEAETWITGYVNGTNLFSLGVHELGHSLGLGHSSDPLSVMYPYFAGGAIGNALSPDDIAAIRSLYAPRYPTLSAHVWGRHTWRSDLVIRLGVRDADGGPALWQTDLLLRAGGDLDDFDFDEIDLTAAAEYFTLDGRHEWFVSLSDVAPDDTGALDGFSIRFGQPGGWSYLFSDQLGAIPDAGTLTATIRPVPEPTSLLLLAAGGAAVAAFRRRSARRSVRTIGRQAGRPGGPDSSICRVGVV